MKAIAKRIIIELLLRDLISAKTTERLFSRLKLWGA
jgi:hypothetical protein